jgi:transcriptional regulator with XRE-family HTH domain
MFDLTTLGKVIAQHRNNLRISQTDLATRARVSRATLAALENGKLGEIGIAKLLRILGPLGLDLTLQHAEMRRPTLDDLLEENAAAERGPE